MGPDSGSAIFIIISLSVTKHDNKKEFQTIPRQGREEKEYDCEELSRILHEVMPVEKDCDAALLQTP